MSVEDTSGRELRARCGRRGARRAAARWWSWRATGAAASGRSARSPTAARAARRHARRARRAARRRRDDAGRQPARVGAARWSPASAWARSCCRAPSSCARRTSRCGSTRRAPRCRLPTSATRTSCGGRPRADARCVLVPDERADAAEPAAGGRAATRRPLPDHVHLRHRGRAEGRAARPALPRPASALQAEHWLGAAARRAGLVHGRRGLVEVGPQRRSSRRGCAAPRRCCTTRASTRTSGCELLARERVNVLCMAPTEYRVIAKRATLRPLAGLRGLVAAGEALNPEVLHAWHEATGLWIRDGYGQTETGQLTGAPLGETAAPRLDGPPAAGRDARRRRRRAGRRPRDRSRRSSCATSASAPHAAAVAHRRPRAPATRTASCTSRAAPTT